MKLMHLMPAAGLAVVALKFGGDLAVRLYEDLDIEETVPEGRLAVVNGVRVHYLDQGNGPALVLIHGLGASTFAFRLNVEELSKHFRVIVPDMPGYGLSGRDTPDMSLTAQAGYLAGLLDELGIVRASIAGHSMGGSVALRFAARFPGRTERLVLIGSTTDEYMARGGRFSAIARQFLPAFTTLVLRNRFARERYLRAAVYDPALLTPEVRAGYAAPGHVRGHTRAYQRLILDRVRDAPVDLASVCSPALLLWGDTDRVVGIENAHALASSLPHARLVVLPNTGHLAPEEQPAALNQLILEFLGAERREEAAPTRR